MSGPVANDGDPRSALPENAAALADALEAVCPAAILVRARILRRVIRADCGMIAWGIRVPHAKTYVIDREKLFQYVDPTELDVRTERQLPDRVILLVQPDAEDWVRRNPGQILLEYWRLLLHSRVHEAMDQVAAEGRLTEPDVRRRIVRLGTTAFDEIRAVLRQEQMVLPPGDDRQIYVEFAAVFWELRQFAPGLLDAYFPELTEREDIERLLLEDVDGPGLFAATRPAGAPDPVESSPRDEDPVDTDEAAFSDRGAGVRLPPSETGFRNWLQRAEAAESTGNLVRSLIYHARAAECAPAEHFAKTRTAMRAGLQAFLQRLERALEIPPDHREPWRRSLLALVHRSTHGIWPVESRLLYDLQKVCVDHEREIFTVDLVEWAISWAKRPIKRPLPSLRDVLMAKHLRTAAARLPAVRLSVEQRREWSSLLQAVTTRAEERMRRRFRPVLVDSLDAVGLTPDSVPERVARDKIVEELLDRIVRRGRLSMGDLRDALSRNNLKLNDVAGPDELLRGDPLLRADRRLDHTLDGVYRRGEFYLRALQRFSSLGFGTRTGRFLTRYAAIPFGGSYMVLEFLDHTIHKIIHREPGLTHNGVVLSFGLFILLMWNVVAFRSGVWRATKTAGRAVHGWLIAPVADWLRSDFVRRLIASPWIRVTWRVFVKPILFSAGVCLFLPLEELAESTAIQLGLILFLTFNLVMNSRIGRAAEETFWDWVSQTWHRFGWRMLAGLFGLIVDFFKQVLEGIERLLYTVDEWLRFRSGETTASFAAKAVLGVVWFFVTYVVRFCVNLLLEPQVNPIKHFPVVTVSHKLLLPTIPAFAHVLSVTLDPWLAGVLATAIIWSIPGIFGFLVWELKENWRLYAANRAAGLRPVVVGDHGETLVRLLRPGFHSGTIPKRFAKLRRAQRKAIESRRWSGVRKHQHALDHAAESIRRFVEREFLTLLDLPGPVRVWVGASAVRVFIESPLPGAEPLEIEFDLEAAWMIARIVKAGWLADSPEPERTAALNALAGLFAAAGVEVVRERLAELIPSPDAVFRFSPRELIVWPDAERREEICYPLIDGPLMPPTPEGAGPVLNRPDVLFSEKPILWSRWCEHWDRAALPDAPPELLPAASVFAICSFPGSAWERK